MNRRSTRVSDARPAPPPGLLRVLVAFHETQALGAGLSVLRAVDDLEERGWAVSGWFPGEGPLTTTARARLASVAASERPHAFSASGWREPPGVGARLRATPRYLRSFRSTLLRVRPHVVHANTLLTLPEAVAARRWGLPLVVQVHEIPQAGAKRTATIRAAARSADVLVAVSEAVAEVLRPHAGGTPVMVVRNGVATVPERPARPRGGPLVVGTVGTVSGTKGTDVFLEAAARVVKDRPDVRFHHVGAPDLHRDAGLDARLGLTLRALPDGAVTMHGSRPAAELLPSFDVFLLPSRSEAFPLSTLEAMAAGLPVIASAVGGVPEQIEHERTGLLVPPGDATALADAVLRLHDDPVLRMRLGQSARERVLEEFPIARQAAGLHHAYLVALNRRFGPPLVRRAAPSLP